MPARAQAHGRHRKRVHGLAAPAGIVEPAHVHETDSVLGIALLDLAGGDALAEEVGHQEIALRMLVAGHDGDALAIRRPVQRRRDERIAACGGELQLAPVADFECPHHAFAHERQMASVRRPHDIGLAGARRGQALDLAGGGDDIHVATRGERDAARVGCPRERGHAVLASVLEVARQFVARERLVGRDGTRLRPPQ